MAGSAIGILATDGVILVGEKKVIPKLLGTSTSFEKMYKIYDHVACAVAGIMSDANILSSTHRESKHSDYQEPMPVEQLVQSLCNTKQGYTQFGGYLSRIIKRVSEAVQLAIKLLSQTWIARALIPKSLNWLKYFCHLGK